jgi:hypothetical protein
MKPALRYPPPALVLAFALYGEGNLPTAGCVVRHGFQYGPDGLNYDGTNASISDTGLERGGHRCSVSSQTERAYRLEYKDSLDDEAWTPLRLVAGTERGHSERQPYPWSRAILPCPSLVK